MKVTPGGMNSAVHPVAPATSPRIEVFRAKTRKTTVYRQVAVRVRWFVLVRNYSLMLQLRFGRPKSGDYQSNTNLAFGKFQALLQALYKY